MRYALKELGYRTYGMGVCVQYYSHLNAWYRHAKGIQQADLRKLLAPYDATVGVPAMFFLDDIIAVSPEVMVVLNVRNMETWWNSYSHLQQLVFNLRKRLWFAPRIRYFFRTCDAFLFHGYFEGKYQHKEWCIGRIEEMNRSVKETIPAKRLLVYEIGNGWEPLCKFLDKPIPNKQFPFINRAENEVKRRVLVAMSYDLMFLTALLAPFVVFGLAPLSLGLSIAVAVALWVLYKLHVI
jgi:hypothetical protein